jgi:hypothetical protein
MSLPETLANGLLPLGVHAAQLAAIIERFGSVTPRRVVLADRLQSCYAWLKQPNNSSERFSLAVSSQTFLSPETWMCFC